METFERPMRRKSDTANPAVREAEAASLFALWREAGLNYDARRRTVLLVDAEPAELNAYSEILKQDFALLTAANAAEALALLAQRGDAISAVLLGAFLPDMEISEILERMRLRRAMDAPTIVVGLLNAADRKRILDLGAAEYLERPVPSAVLLLHLRAAISRRESAMVRFLVEFDPLTGLYNKDAFVHKTEELLRTAAPGAYIIASMDVARFKVVNDLFGRDTGDVLLKHMAEDLITLAYGKGVVCRVTADQFALCMRRDDTGRDEQLRAYVSDGRRERFELPFEIVRRVGIYVVNDPKLAVDFMLDRAGLAQHSVKDSYLKRYAYYAEDMRREILEEQEITGAMNEALAKGQFDVYLQPQINHATGELVGAEALVRWLHPEKGVLAPGRFLDIFERNGFIVKLDKYIWERVCRLLRTWLDEGRKIPPVSVNVSREDIMDPGFFNALVWLIEDYNIPVQLFRLEITETVIAQSPVQIIDALKRLRAYGFVVEVDDFGSGYSSLNTLKNVPADIIKMDMRFFEDDGDLGRGGVIISSMVRMAKWLKMPVIAEGVEQRKQADYLQSVGCDYIQGYLYAKPMPVAEFEALLDKSNVGASLQSMSIVENMDPNAFWDPRSQETLIFNSFVGAVCVLEYNEAGCELLRVNKRYVTELGMGLSEAELLRRDPMSAMAAADRAATIEAIQKVVREGGEAECVTRRRYAPDAPELFIRSRFMCIVYGGGSALLYATVENITERLENERRVLETSMQLETIMAHMIGGVAVYAVAENKSYLRFANAQFYKVYGYTREQFESEVTDTYALVLAEDLPRLQECVNNAEYSGGVFSVSLRARKRDGTVVRLRCSERALMMNGEVCFVTVINDVTAEEASEVSETLFQKILRIATGPDFVCACIINPRMGVYRFYGDHTYDVSYMGDFDGVSAAFAAACITSDAERDYFLRNCNREAAVRALTHADRFCFRYHMHMKNGSVELREMTFSYMDETRNDLLMLERRILG